MGWEKSDLMILLTVDSAGTGMIRGPPPGPPSQKVPGNMSERTGENIQAIFILFWNDNFIGFVIPKFMKVDDKL